MYKKLNGQTIHQLIKQSIVVPKDIFPNYLEDTFNVMELLELNKRLSDRLQYPKTINLFVEQTTYVLNEIQNIVSNDDFKYQLQDYLDKELNL